LSTTIAERARDRNATGFVGRRRELQVLHDAVAGDRTFVVHVHGVAGIGKSSLLNRFVTELREAGSLVVELDGRSLEPTDRGLVDALSAGLGASAANLEMLRARLREGGTRTVIVIDNYEVLRLVDTWLRQVLVPALPDTARVILAGREPPVAGWLTAPDLAGAVEVLYLGPLEAPSAIELLRREGVEGASAEAAARVARGHPLALRLAAAAARERPDVPVEEAAAPRVIDELTRLYLADVSDPITRRALEASAVVRRMTTSLLAGMLPDVDPADAFDRLRSVPFGEVRQDGLMVHEAVQSALARSLHASDPARYRQYRRAAWQVLRNEVREVGDDELWRYTADMLYLIENPVVREAFFPSGAQPLAVEPATPADLPAIEHIAERHDGSEGRRLMLAWWRLQPDAFAVVRDRDGQVTGFHCLLDQAVLLAPRVDDPVVAGWWRHLRANPPPAGQRVLGYRRWLDLEHGELPCATQAASWLDVKRTYMLLRPKLRRMFTVVHDPSPYLAVILKLGFRPLGEADGTAEIDGRTYTSVGLDFGPESVDGWLAGLVAAELGIAAEVVVDAAAREVRLNGHTVQLTPLEFGVLDCLQRHEGRPVTRATLLDEVWGYRSDVGSNVVDAVVRRLREKLGEKGSSLETVRGSGYRLTVR
jgi:hypothetical protein